MAKKSNPNKPPQRAQALRHLADGVERTKRTMSRWPDHPDALSMGALRDKLEHAQAYLVEVAEELEKLPPAFPPRRIAAASLIQPGVEVRVRDTYRSVYENLIPGAELDALSVVAVNNHHLTFKTRSGIVSMAPKKHVKVVEG